MGPSNGFLPVLHVVRYASQGKFIPNVFKSLSELKRSSRRPVTVPIRILHAMLILNQEYLPVLAENFNL